MKVLLVGSAYMAQEYGRVLNYLKVPFDIVARSEESVATFKELFGCSGISGGVRNVSSKHQYTHAIVASSRESLHEVISEVLSLDIKYLLVEKPGVFWSSISPEINKMITDKGATCVVGYNRRFYRSLEIVKQLIDEDGGALSCSFSFTEWMNKVDFAIKSDLTKSRWLLGNSIHVFDLVQYVIGEISTLDFKSYGDNVLPCHPNSSIFVGHGISKNNVAFSYHSNWVSAGSWYIDFHTTKRKISLNPIESVKVQLKDSNQQTVVHQEESFEKLKFGLLNQTKAFLNNELEKFPTFCENSKLVKLIEEIGLYSNNP